MLKGHDRVGTCRYLSTLVRARLQQLLHHHIRTCGCRLDLPSDHPDRIITTIKCALVFWSPLAPAARQPAWVHHLHVRPIEAITCTHCKIPLFRFLLVRIRFLGMLQTQSLASRLLYSMPLQVNVQRRHGFEHCNVRSVPKVVEDIHMPIGTSGLQRKANICVLLIVAEACICLDGQ